MLDRLGGGLARRCTHRDGMAERMSHAIAHLQAPFTALIRDEGETPQTIGAPILIFGGGIIGGIDLDLGEGGIVASRVAKLYHSRLIAAQIVRQHAMRADRRGQPPPPGEGVPRLCQIA